MRYPSDLNRIKIYKIQDHDQAETQLPKAFKLNSFTQKNVGLYLVN